MKSTNAVRTEIHYAQVGEYQLPLLTLPQTDDTEPLGKYGRMRLAYLKNHRPVLYNQMLLNGTLWPHLQEVQRAASEQLERTIAALADKFTAPDKERSQLFWAAHMNGLKAQAEEVVVREVVYTTSLTTTSSACAFSPFIWAAQKSCDRSLSGAVNLSAKAAIVRSSCSEAALWTSCKCGQSVPFSSIWLYSTGR